VEAKAEDNLLSVAFITIYFEVDRMCLTLEMDQKSYICRWECHNVGSAGKAPSCRRPMGVSDAAAFQQLFKKYTFLGIF